MTASILIPAYNASNFLTATLESCVNQGEENVHEIIVIDDQSEDDTLALAQHFAKAHPQFDFVIEKSLKKALVRAQSGLCVGNRRGHPMARRRRHSWTKQTKNSA